jgi:hypothetical protein
VTSAVIDMAGYSEITFIGGFGTKNAGNYAKVQQDTDSAGGTLADLTGTKCGAGEDHFAVSVVKPRERYVACVLTRGASTTTTPLYAILSKPKVGPVSSDLTGTLDAEVHISPAEGTA